MSDARLTVLCVDDDPALLAAIVRALGALDADIISTCKPSVALELISQREIAVLVSDHEMPGMTGTELAMAARRLRPETVRILLTGRQEFETALQGINECEVFRYINKPFDTKTLRKVVTEGLAKHREVLATSRVTARGARRQLITNALEAEFPGLTVVAIAPDGAYIVGDPAATLLVEAGLEELATVGRRQK
jgi:response regulator RpfG family c-di-GMP phosphodiesterase